MLKITLYILLPVGFIACLMLILIISAGMIFPSYKPPIVSKDDRFINVNGSNIHYELRDGKKPTLIFLHGFGSDHRAWDKIQSMVENESLLIDLIGFGKSDRPVIRYDLEAHRKYILAVIDALNIQNAVLVGHSMGASIAAWTAAKTKGKIIGVILFAPSAYPGSLKYSWPFNWLYKPGLVNKVGQILVTNAIFKRLFPHSLAMQALSITDSYDSKFSEVLSNIHQPTLLAWSRGDTTTPFEFHVKYKEKIPQLEFVELPVDLGHGIYWKSQGKSAAIINSYVSRKYSYE